MLISNKKASEIKVGEIQVIPNVASNDKGNRVLIKSFKNGFEGDLLISKIRSLAQEQGLL